MENINFSNIAKIYEKSSLVQRSAAETLLELLCIGKNHSVLDLGCGTGHLSKRIREFTGGKIVGVDSAEGMIKMANEKNTDPNMCFRAADAYTLDYEESFDIVFCNSAFQWFKTPESALNRMFQALVKGGRLGIQAPATSLYCPNFISALEAVKADLRTKDVYSHFHSPWYFLESAEDYASLFESCGYKVLFSKIETLTENYTTAEVFNIFSSGAAAGYLNQNFYSTPLDSHYVDSFREIVREELQKQCLEDGYVPLTFNRIFLVAEK